MWSRSWPMWEGLGEKQFWNPLRSCPPVPSVRRQKAVVLLEPVSEKWCRTFQQDADWGNAMGILPESCWFVDYCPTWPFSVKLQIPMFTPNLKMWGQSFFFVRHDAELLEIRIWTSIIYMPLTILNVPSWCSMCLCYAYLYFLHILLLSSKCSGLVLWKFWEVVWREG